MGNRLTLSKLVRSLLYIQAKLFVGSKGGNDDFEASEKGGLGFLKLLYIRCLEKMILVSGVVKRREKSAMSNRCSAAL